MSKITAGGHGFPGENVEAVESKHTPTPWFYNQDEGGYQGQGQRISNML